MSTDHPAQDDRCAGCGLPGRDDASATARAGNSYSATVFWLAAWGGTVAAGGVFGLLTGVTSGGPLGVVFERGLIGLVGGAFIAGVIGGLIHITMAAVTWVLWLSRFSIAMAGIAGALTWIVATSDCDGPQPYAWIAIGVLIGGLGGALGGGRYHARFRQRSGVHGSPPAPRWQFSIRDLLLRFVVVAALVSGWNWLYHWIRVP